jgi:hypothetical protein
MSRRSVLAGAGYAVAGTTAGQLLAVAQAQEVAQVRQGQGGAGICLSMLFENAAKAKFETEKYVKNHLPLLREVYGDSVERIEVRTSNGSSMGVPSALLASTTLWISDVQGFSQKLGANAERINKDLDAVAKGNRLVQPDRIVFTTGDGRSDIPASSQIFSLYYRAFSGPMRGGRGGRGPGPGPAPGAQPAPGADPAPTAPSFDAAYFADVFLPKLYSLHGSSSARRLEGTTGMDQGAQKATQIAAYHIYIRDRSAYDQKSMSAFTEMQKDAEKFTQGLIPVFADMRLTAIA